MSNSASATIVNFKSTNPVLDLSVRELYGVKIASYLTPNTIKAFMAEINPDTPVFYGSNGRMVNASVIQFFMKNKDGPKESDLILGVARSLQGLFPAPFAFYVTNEVLSNRNGRPDDMQPFHDCYAVWKPTANGIPPMPLNVLVHMEVKEGEKVFTHYTGAVITENAGIMVDCTKNKQNLVMTRDVLVNVVMELIPGMTKEKVEKFSFQGNHGVLAEGGNDCALYAIFQMVDIHKRLEKSKQLKKDEKILMYRPSLFTPGDITNFRNNELVKFLIASGLKDNLLEINSNGEIVSAILSSVPESLPVKAAAQSSKPASAPSPKPAAAAPSPRPAPAAPPPKPAAAPPPKPAAAPPPKPAAAPPPKPAAAPPPKPAAAPPPKPAAAPIAASALGKHMPDGAPTEEPPAKKKTLGFHCFCCDKSSFVFGYHGWTMSLCGVCMEYKPKLYACKKTGICEECAPSKKFDLVVRSFFISKVENPREIYPYLLEISSLHKWKQGTYRGLNRAMGAAADWLLELFESVADDASIDTQGANEFIHNILNISDAPLPYMEAVEIYKRRFCS